MTTPAGFKSLLEAKKRSMRILIDNGEYHNAYENVGIMVEYALKIVICKEMGRQNYPDTLRKYKTHNVHSLIEFARLEEELNKVNVIGTEFYTNWSIVTVWDISTRYNEAWESTKEHIEEIWEALFNEKEGVITWISNKW